MKLFLLFYLILVVDVGLVLLFEFSKYNEWRYLAVVWTAYIVQRVVPEHRLPMVEMGKIWFFSQVFLYGTLGAELNFHLVYDKSMLWKSFLLILVATFIRFTMAFISTFMSCKKFTWKERVFISQVWCPKGVLQALTAYILFNQAISENLEQEFIDETNINYSTTILSVILTQPLFSLLDINLGPKPRKAFQ